ncbi:MAG: MATE family efflux transporter [Pseudomonadota bacterium]
MGDPEPVTHRRVLRIAVPIVLSNATVPILGAVDTGVVGQMGQAAPIGAVGLGAIILTAIYWVFGFLRMGTTGLAAQAHGRGDHAEIAALLSRALFIAGLAGLALIILQYPLFRGAFYVAPASDEVETLARTYLEIRIWSAPAAIAIYGITGWLIAAERTRAVLLLQLWMNGVNILLDLWFVLGLGWGVGGVAFATFIAEWSALGLGLWLCRAAFQGRDWRRAALVFDRARIMEMSAVNGDILVRSVLLQAAFVSFLFFGAGLGDVTLAANQVLLQFLHVTAYALDGFAFAAEAIVGQAVGARKIGPLRRGARMATVWALGTVCVLSLIFWGAGNWAIDLMTTAPDVRGEARRYLSWLVLAPVLGVWAFMLDGVFIGATRTRDMRNMMAVSFGVYVLAVAALLPSLGNHGLWAAIMIMFVVRALTLLSRYPALENSVNQSKAAV